VADKDSGSWIKYVAWGSTIAFTFAGLVAGGYFLGNFLDSCLGTDPWLKIVLMIAGVFLGIGYLVVLFTRLRKPDDEQ